MPFHLDPPQLRVLDRYAKQERNRSALRNSRLILLQHILPNTEEFVRHLLAAECEIFAVVAKPYSIDARVLASLEAIPLRILKHTYAELETTSVLSDLLLEAVERSKIDGKQIIIVEIGGYFSKVLTELPLEAAQFIAGVVEDTTFGHNRYATAVSEIPVPVFSVARSALKEIEARLVGKNAVAAVERVLSEQGVTIVGRKALVIGYGMIGSQVARALRSYGLDVLVYDKHDYRNLQAFMDGFYIHKKRELLKVADIVFAATADRALTFEEIEEAKSNVLLVSVGSKDTEFDVSSLREQAVKVEKASTHAERFYLSSQKRIVLINNGTAVNFILGGLPTEVLDLVFTEVFLCMMLLLKSQKTYVPGTIYQSPDTFLNEIARDWLRSINVT